MITEDWKAVASLPERVGAPRERTHIVLADADPIARMVIRDALGQEEAIVVVAQAHDGVEAVELALHYRPELLLTELIMPRMAGMEILARVREEAPEVGVVFFSSTDSPRPQMDALLAGARGFLSKQLPLATVVETLGQLRRDEAAVSAHVAADLVRALCALPKAGTGVRPVRSTLTQREWEILDLLSAGESVDQIAMTLGVVSDTVRSHLKHARAKLRVKSDDDVVDAAHLLVQTKGMMGVGLQRGRTVGRRGGDGNRVVGGPPLDAVGT